MNWVSVNDRLPKQGERVLLLYCKAKKSGHSGGSIGEFMTEGYLLDRAETLANESLDRAFWVRNGYGFAFFDYTDRQIQSLTANKSTNQVTHWAELPQKPKK